MQHTAAVVCLLALFTTIAWVALATLYATVVSSLVASLVVPSAILALACDCGLLVVVAAMPRYRADDER